MEMNIKLLDLVDLPAIDDKRHDYVPSKQENSWVKFGEIYVMNCGKFRFICNCCEEGFSKAIELAEHVIEQHYIRADNDALRNSFQLNATDFDTRILGKCTSFYCPPTSPTKSSTHDNTKALCPSTKTTLEEDRTSELVLQHPDPTSNKLNTNKKSSKYKIRRLKGDVNWQCHLCNVILKCTSKYDHLKRHSSSNTIKYKCTYCNDEFITKVRRRNHERQHTGESERPIKCSDCSKCFKSKVILKNHIKRDHLNIREHQCNFCEKKFYLKAEKISHERSNHTKEKPCICEICGLSFRVQQKLNIHIQNHGEPQFQCDKCDKKFHAKANLKRHQICHNNQKPFTCEFCSASFPRLCAYKTHLKLHSNVKEYICRFCSRDYHDISGIKCHMKSAHCLQYNKINVLRRSQLKETDIT